MKLKILIKKGRFFLTILFLGALFSMVNGKQPKMRVFDKERMIEYKQQKEFGYMNYVAQPPSIWERISWWFQRMLERVFMNPNTPWLVQITYYLLLVLIVGAAIWYIVRLRYGKGLLPDSRRYSTPIVGMNHMEDQDYTLLIQDALKDRNFALAIRYEYLRALSLMAGKGLIQLKESKSPFDYERELDGDLANEYKELARLFEYVWYGEFKAGEEEYNRGNELSKGLTERI